MHNSPVLARFIVAMTDILVTVLSFIVASDIRNYSLSFYDFGKEVEWHQYPLILVIILLLWRMLMGLQQAYVGKRYSSLRKDMFMVLKTVFIGCTFVLALAFFIKSEVPRTLILYFGLVNLVFLSFTKMLEHRLFAYLRKKGVNVKKVLVVGTNGQAHDFISSVKTYSDWGLEVIGIINENSREEGKGEFEGIAVTPYSQFKEFLHSHHIDELVIAVSPSNMGNIGELIATCDEEGVPVRIISPFFKNLISTAKADVIHGIPVISIVPVEVNDLEMALKRVMDIVGSFLGLIILSPLLLGIAVAVKLSSPGPVFYRWKVLGLHKRPLVSYKFRTMYENADELKEELKNRNEMDGAAFKMANDPRITPLGKILRKYSLDELPQLWSVLKGDLSLVGPRPPLQTEIEAYKGWHRRKLSVKPGLTCLWQINGRNKINNFDQWMKLDLEYIDRWNLWLDIRILFKTIPAVFRGTGQ